MEGQTPEPSPQSATGAGRQLRFVGAVAFVVLLGAGGFAASRLAADPNETEVADTTAFQADSVGSRGVELLGWQQSGSIGETRPVSLLEYQGSFFLFGTPGWPFFSSLGGSGLDAWVSSDGRSWTSLGTVIGPPHLVRSVTSTPQGLVALGDDGESGMPTVWVSSDGSDWVGSALPNDGSGPVGSRTWLTAAGGTEDQLVVFGRNDFDPTRLIFDHLPEEFKIESTDQTYGVGFGGSPLEVTIDGPLGIIVFSATAEELGLSEDEVALLARASESPPTTVIVWSSVDGKNWATGHMDATYITHVSVTPFGDLIAFGHKRGTSAIWFSNDGLVWDRQTTSGVINYQVTPWKDGFVGIRNQGSELAYSADGWEWDPLAVDVLPTEDTTWQYRRITAGGAGITAVAHGPSTAIVPSGPIQLEKDGYTLTVERWGGPLFLTWGDSELLEIIPQGPQVLDQVVVDFQAETITFLVPDLARPLVTFTFDEVTSAEQAHDLTSSGNQLRAVLFSTDGLQWSVQDLDEIIGTDRQISLLLVTSDGVVAATTHPRLSLVSGGSPPPTEVEMWFAPIP